MLYIIILLNHLTKSPETPILRAFPLVKCIGQDARWQSNFSCQMHSNPISYFVWHDENEIAPDIGGNTVRS